MRSWSAARLTQDLLSRLDEAMAQYLVHSGKVLPQVARFVEDEHVEESDLQRRAFENNRTFTLALLRQPKLTRETIESISLTAQTPENAGIRDAWGGPVVFMPSQHPAIGMAPGDRPFFLSAGPDGRYLTRDDNLYSYDFTLPDFTNETRRASEKEPSGAIKRGRAPGHARITVCQ